MPDISKINNVEVANISKLDSITFADGQKVNNQDVSLITDAHTFISSQTASGSSSLTFSSGIDSTYDVYEFHFINIHPNSHEDYLVFQVNPVGGSGFNQLMTTAFFRAYETESDSSQGVGYRGDFDQQAGSSYQYLTEGIAANSSFNDSSASGVLRLYSPSNTTYMKHFNSRVNFMSGSPVTVDTFVGGYVQTSSAIDEIDFKCLYGNMDAGEIRLYGVATS